MASSSRTIPQKDFALGATRPESLERSDTDLLNRSVKTAKNVMILSTGSMQVRPGSFYLATVDGDDAKEIEPTPGTRYIMTLVSGGLTIYDRIGDVVVSFTGAPWATGTELWVNDLGDTIQIGSQTTQIHALTYEDGAFSFGTLAFATGSGDALAQPYYPYEPSITLTPSALTGSITLTTDQDFFNADYVGQRIRYGEREILIDSVTDGKNAAGTVQQELPPTKLITVASASGFQVGDSVEHATLGGQGIITDISGTDITVFVTKFFTGFNGTSANLVGPNARSNISAQVDAPSPAGTQLWDEPLMSPARGYAGYCTEHRGRVILCDFPQAPNVVALSASSTVNDYTVGTNDDDAIVDEISANRAQRVLYAVSAEDLVILTSRGCYYQETREGTTLTPGNWDPVEFDSMGAAPIQPARVHDGVVFVAKNGQNIYGAILQGDIYKAWSLVPLSEFHNHLIKTPVRLTATDNDSIRPERFVFVVNSDGTVAIMRWERGPAYPNDTVGWVEWNTTGSFKLLFIAFGQIHALVERTINGATVTYLERFDDDAFLDAATGFADGVFAGVADENGDAIVDENGDKLVGQIVSAAHLAGDTAALWVNDWDMGDYTISSIGQPVDADGNLVDIPDGTPQVGLPFTMQINGWSRRSEEGYGSKQESQRVIDFKIAVWQTIRFTFNDDEEWGGYRAGEDLTIPPPRRDEHVRFRPAEREHYNRLEITKDRPGPFTMTAMFWKVQL